MKYFLVLMITIVLMLFSTTAFGEVQTVSTTDTTIYKYGDDTYSIKITVNTGSIINSDHLSVISDSQHLNVTGKSMVFFTGSNTGILSAAFTISTEVENVDVFNLRFNLDGSDYVVKLQLINSRLIVID